jgi:DNA-binding NarL/FixJ family response regulator
MMGTIRVVLADDHAVVRRGVRSLLEAPDIEVVAEAGDGHQALAAVAAHRPDVLMTDIAMPGMTGLELAERVARDFPPTRVLILSMHKDKAYATRALAAGAAG